MSNILRAVDSSIFVIQNRITMSTTVTVRDLRNQFPKVRKLVETQGEVVLTEKGKPRYRLTTWRPEPAKKAPSGKDYVKRMSRFQSQPLDATQAATVHEENRGDR